MSRRSLIAKLLDNLDEIKARLDNLEEDILQGLWYGQEDEEE